jgi:vacuolar-type H+-ATPase subunit I/STV1
MIVPMKKISLIALRDEKIDTLNRLKKLGIMQIEITEGQGQNFMICKRRFPFLKVWFSL